MTQKERVLTYLRQEGVRGINSFKARNVLNVIQLPTRIYELKKMGYLITERHNKDLSVDYILVQEPKQRIETEERQWQWDFRGNTARKVLVNPKPVQNHLF